MISLHFERISVECPARAAGILQTDEQGRKVVRVSREPAHNGHDLSLLAFLDRQPRGLFFGRNKGLLYRFRGA